jgi:predicted AAA+ superfamily ATPase
MARILVDPRSRGYFDLEDPIAVTRLSEPMTALGALEGTVVIDEIQRRPDLFPALRVLADRRPLPARFLILGSATPSMLQQSSETLAGRLEIVEMGGFALDEVGVRALHRHWLRGGFPLSFLARTLDDSSSWRRDFVRTFLERELPSFGVNIAPSALLRFWTMLAHVHGGVWNAADPARSLGVSEPTVRRYLDVLSGVYMVRQLRPWHANVSKRQVKSPKVYFRDSGLLHSLLGVRTERDLLNHPKSGASWEGYALEETLKVVEPDEAYFWATHSGAELDLLLIKEGRRLGVEMKRADAPRMTPSIRIAIADLRLEQVVVLYPGDEEYELAENVRVVPLSFLSAGYEALFPRGRRRSRRK